MEMGDGREDGGGGRDGRWVMGEGNRCCWNRKLEKSPANLREKASKISGEGAAFLYTTEPPAIRQPELRAEAAIDGTSDSFLSASGTSAARY
jgi:hypothetical protein